jgi:hypothetical protein
MISALSTPTPPPAPEAGMTGVYAACSETHEPQKQEPTLLERIEESIKRWDERKPLPEMSQVATAVLALNRCLNFIDEIKAIAGSARGAR